MSNYVITQEKSNNHILYFVTSFPKQYIQPEKLDIFTMHSSKYKGRCFHQSDRTGSNYLTHLIIRFQS